MMTTLDIRDHSPFSGDTYENEKEDALTSPLSRLRSMISLLKRSAQCSLSWLIHIELLSPMI